MFDPAEILAAAVQAASAAPAPGAEMDELEIALGNAARAEARLNVIVAMRQMSFTLMQAVHQRAMEEEAAAARAAAATEALGGHANREDASRAAASDRAPVSTESKAGSRTGGSASPRAPARLCATALFVRLSAIVGECLKMEVRAEETFKMMQARVPSVRAALLRKGKAYSPSRADAHKEVFDLTWAVIDEEEENKEDGRNLRAAVVERVRRDPAYEDLADWPLTVAAALICEDLGLEPDRPDWLPDGAAPARCLRHARPRWSPFCRPSRKPYLKPTGHYLVDRVD